MKFRDITPFNIRLPAELKAKLKAEADKKTGSINAEVLARLAASFEKTGLENYTDGELIDELIRRWGREAVCIRLGDGGTPPP
jgi:hypothetical protein